MHQRVLRPRPLLVTLALQIPRVVKQHRQQPQLETTTRQLRFHPGPMPPQQQTRKTERLAQRVLQIMVSCVRRLITRQLPPKRLHRPGKPTRHKQRIPIRKHLRIHCLHHGSHRVGITGTDLNRHGDSKPTSSAPFAHAFSNPTPRRVIRHLPTPPNLIRPVPALPTHTPAGGRRDRPDPGPVALAARRRPARPVAGTASGSFLSSGTWRREIRTPPDL